MIHAEAIHRMIQFRMLFSIGKGYFLLSTDNIKAGKPRKMAPNEGGKSI
jgi:hypothetical protein